MIDVRYSAISIAIMAVVTVIIRALPFVIFERGGKVPAFVEYLGKVLPPAIMSFLLIYCVRNVDVKSASHGIPELIGVASAIILHFWKRNTFFSIGVSTVLYMFLIQVVF